MFSRLLLTTTLVFAIFPTPARSQGTPIGFEEEFALSANREEALSRLIPGTHEYYYYQALHLQNTERFDEVPPLLALWRERHGSDSRLQQIEFRQALLSYERNPSATYRFVREKLGLLFNHLRERVGAPPDLPTRLDPAAVSLATFTQRALDSYPGRVDGFRDSAFDFLIKSDLDEQQLSNLLARLQRPDLPNLPALIVRDLERRGFGFGTMEIHKSLLLDQLDECAQLRPKLWEEGAFVATYLQQLRPSNDVDWTYDRDVLDAYLTRVERLAERLSPSFNSLKAQILYHRLLFDHTRGVHDKETFMAFLRLPRRFPYVEPKWIEKTRADQFANLSSDVGTGLAQVSSDEGLVRAYFTHFFRDEASYESYRPFVSTRYLERLFAETKIVAGIGDMERWYSMLDDPSYYEALEQRVEIDFAATLPRYWPVDLPVALDVDIKNVSNLIVKVFAIDTFNYARDFGKEPDATIDLDGLIANGEQTYHYDEIALRRVRRHFEFEEITGRGVFVIDFIGNGLSSRAVIRRGSLRFQERTGAAGQVFTLLDETGGVRADGKIWLEGQEYAADEDGEILLPFSTSPGTKTLLLRDGDLCSTQPFTHKAESYSLAAGIHLNREALLADRRATIVVRPSLMLNGAPISASLLQEPVLTVVSFDRDGNSSRLDVRDLTFGDDRETTHEIGVPNRLASLSVELRGRIESLSTGDKVELSSGATTFPVNGIDATAQTSAALLGRSDAGWTLDLLGRNGEPKADHAVTLTFEHRHFTEPLQVGLKTDANGRVDLGPLPGIVSIRASGLPGGADLWRLQLEQRSLPNRLHGAGGEILRVGLPSADTPLDKTQLSLLEVRDGRFVRDSFDNLAIREGAVELRDLPAGDYDLWLKEVDAHIAVSVTSGSRSRGWVTGSHRALELSDTQPLRILNVAPMRRGLRVQLAGATDSTRVHVYTTRYVPPFDVFEQMSGFGDAIPHELSLDPTESLFASGRAIGEEYRYILERRYAKRFPGNMLERPSLLLNPWALEATNAVVGAGGGAGGTYGGRGGAKRNRGAGGGPVTEYGGSSPAGTFPNLDFLNDPPSMLTNLRPDEKGGITLPAEALGLGSIVHVVAVDFGQTVYTTTTLPEQPLTRRDRSLTRPLDPDRHFTEQRRIEFVDAGESLVLENASTTELKSFDSLASVFDLYASLTGDRELDKFAFIAQWPEKSQAEKIALYDKFACHELHFFVHEKDPRFFKEVVRPYLAQKLDKTFLDHWLLEDDLTRFLDPWAFARLNVVEKVLLARRISDDQTRSVARYLGEEYELLPPQFSQDQQRFGRLFDTGMLADGDTLAIELSKSLPPQPAASARSRFEVSEPVAADEVEEEKAVAFDQEEIDADTAQNKLEASRKQAKLKDAARRYEPPTLYRELDATRAYVEHNYWRRPIEEQDETLVGVNRFWLDFAENPTNAAFYSKHLADPVANFTEMMFALSLLDLPFKAGEHTTQLDGDRFTIQAASPLLVVRKALVPVDVASESAAVLVQQNFFSPDDRYRFEGNRRIDRHISDEFLLDTVYGCQIVLTNPTSSPRRLDVMIQVPERSIPVLAGSFTRSIPVELNAYSTTTFEYQFYFPTLGSRRQFPVHVLSAGDLIGFADAPTLSVVAEPSVIDTTSWPHVSQDGTEEDVVRFLASSNPQRLDLDKIAWRMRDRAFFDVCTDLLRQRHIYSDTLWSYSILHQAQNEAREYLSHATSFLAQCGRYLDSPLVTLDPVERRTYQHVEYWPLINERAHRFGKEVRINDRDLASQYLSLLDLLIRRPTLDDEDWMTVTYYLLLQDRVEEAITCFEKVDSRALPTQIQYDYMDAYLDFFADDPAVARRVADKYRDYPVKRWNDRFAEIRTELDELDGATTPSNDGDPTDSRRLTNLAESAPSLELDIDARRVLLRHKNVDSAEVRYYLMDVEFLFSNSPFVQNDSGSFAYVRPNRVDVLELPPEQATTSFALPTEYNGSNLLVEVRGGGTIRRQTYFANSLSVQVIENFGQVRVTHAKTGKPLAKTYVKVFAQGDDGKVRFHKDGYTDLRGRFDYASVTGPRRSETNRYALLVLNDEAGAAIREVSPPLK